MNAETLHSIALAVRADLTHSGIRERLTELEAALTNAINAPQDPNLAQAVVNAREQLREAVLASQMPNFPPIWLEYLGEMGVGDIVGQPMLDRIERSFADNQVTLPAVLTEVTSVRQWLTEAGEAFDRLIAGLAFMNIGTDVLQPGEVELAFLIPRQEVHNELGDLGRELNFIARRIIGPFQELATGTRGPVEVRTVASSNFSMLLGIDLETARLFGRVVSFLIGHYRQILEIRKIKADMERVEMPPAIVDSVEAQAAAKMTSAITELTQSVMSEFSTNLRDEQRAHEVDAELQMSLENIAYRIDVGYSIQVRSMPPELPEVEEGDEPDSTTAQIGQIHAEIAELRDSLSFLRLEGSPILALPAAQPPDEMPPSVSANEDSVHDVTPRSAERTTTSPPARSARQPRKKLTRKKTEG